MKWIFIKNFVALLFFIALFACSPTIRFTTNGISTNHLNTNTSESSLNSFRKRILTEIEKWIGTPYCYGGESRRCVDCSGFVSNIFASVGYTLPRTSNEQSRIGSPIDFKDIDIGDLMFFGKSKSIEHVAIYIGNGEIAHSTSSRGVIKEKIKPSNFNEIITIRRIIP
ncbi:MAG: C40 family peptidase [Candidatus Kapaibacteriales bacterium]